MKKLLKRIFAQTDYLLYFRKIKKGCIRVQTIEETIDELSRTGKSLVRFGDGEITMIRGKSLAFQEVNPEIVEGLKRILGYEYDGLVTAIPEIFGDLNIYRKETADFWKEHLFFSRKIYLQYCNGAKAYGNAYLSRFYYPMADKNNCDRRIAKIKQLWKDRDVVVVEGERTHNGVGNDLLDSVRSIERILGPGTQAFAKVDEIMECCREYPKDRLFLLSLGIAAKFLAEKLFLEGYQVLDIGNLDMEYEWYLHRAETKEKIPKHDIIGEEANLKAGYEEYLAQIKRKVI